MRRSHLATAALAVVGLAKAPALGAASLTETHPVPEYAATEAVLLSEDLFNWGYDAPTLTRAVLDAGADVWVALGEASPAKGAEATARKKLAEAGLTKKELERVRVLTLPHGNIWMRDFGPLALKSGKPGSERLALADFAYDGGESHGDAFPAAVGKAADVPVVPVPAQVDGGNILAMGDTCFTSAPAIPKDAKGQTPTELEPGPRAFAAKMGDAIGCKRVVVLDDPPHAHLDMWMKIVGDGKILVNQIDEPTIGRARALFGQVPDDVAALRDRLDEMAKTLAQYGEVERLPMPLPYRNVFRTYANALLVNGVAIVPSYERFGWNYDDYPDANLREHFEQAATAVYAKYGYRTRLVHADGLVYNGGAFHCVMLQLPKLGAGLSAALHSKGH